MKYRIYFNGTKCKISGYKVCAEHIEKAICLSDLVQIIEVTNWVDSYTWKFKIKNNSSITIQYDYSIQVSDSSSIMAQDSDSNIVLAPGDTDFIEIEASSLISGGSVSIDVYAEGAEGFTYEEEH